MGTYSDFKLQVKEEVDLDVSEILHTLIEISDYRGWDYNSDEKAFKLENVKWYDFDSHMCRISEIYPQFTFVLLKDGECNNEPDDNIWEHHFLNGVEFLSVHITPKSRIHYPADEIKELNKNVKLIPK